MIDRVLFSKILTYSQISSKEEIDKLYAQYQEFFQEFIDDSNSSIIPRDTKCEYVELSILYAAQWGSLALACIAESLNSPLGIAYQAIFSAIANYTLSITHLAISGMDLQSNTLLRNLYELITLFLAITIDDDLQNEFLKDISFKDMDMNWYKHLRHKKIQKIVQRWEESQPLTLDDVLGEDQNVTYKRLSSMVHSQYAPILVLSFTKSDNSDDIVIPNVWGKSATRIEPILCSLHAILSYTNISLLALIKNKNQILMEKLKIPKIVNSNDMGKRFFLFLNLSNWCYSYYYVKPVLANTTC